MTGVHNGFNPRSVCKVVKGIVNATHESLRRNGDPEALRHLEIEMAVRPMNMPSYRHENAELLRRLPQRTQHLNKALFIEVPSESMTFFKKCVKLAQKNGLFVQKMGPGVQPWFTGIYDEPGMMSDNEKAQAIRAQRSLNYWCKVETIDEFGDPGQKFKAKNEKGEYHELLGKSSSVRQLVKSISVDQNVSTSSAWFPWSDQMVPVPGSGGYMECRVFNDKKGTYYKGKRDSETASTGR